MAMLPLEGIRVLDLTTSWAGPWCTKILGDLGAEVIKIEAIQAYDLTRGPVGREDWRAYARRRSSDPPYERADSFLKPNRNKLGVTLNLKDPRGADLFRALARKSDVVAENYAPGEMEKFGLGFDSLRELNPRLVLLRMPAIGAEGPERDYVGFGTTIEMLSGLTELTGYEDGPPMKSGFWYGDPISGIHAAGAVLMALWEREVTGQGQILEVAQLETLTGFAADAILQYVVNGSLYERMGNRDLEACPQGCYPARGEDSWLVLTVCNAEQWRGLARLLGREDWERDPLLQLAGGRRARQDEIDRAIGAWSATRGRDEAVDALLAAGIPAAPVYLNRDIFADPHVRERGFLEEVTHPVAGTHQYPASAWILDGERLRTRRPAPLLGQHNHEVLRGVLGLSEQEIAELEAAQVIGSRPVVDVWGG